VVLTLFQASDLKDDTYLDALNSLLISGEYPPLFSEDELESLLQVSILPGQVLVSKYICTYVYNLSPAARLTFFNAV
jgi:hypothetical protein